MTRLRVLLASVAVLSLGHTARADDAPADISKPAADTTPAEAPTAPPAAPTTFANGINLAAQIEAGIIGYPDASRGNNRAFGQLFTDHTNQAQLNQVLLTASKVIDPKATDFDWGFKLQGLYGSDARITHFVGELDRTIGDRYQLDVVEANVSLHIPVLTEGGLDFKIGQYVTPLGAETIDPSTNAFYSKSYIFNFGIPLKHTGFYGTLHTTPVLDLWGGLDTGSQTSFGQGQGDNNSAVAGLFGFGLNLMDGALTVLALSHIGSETSYRVVQKANDYLRYENDIVVTYKATDALTLVSEFNYIHDDFADASGGGFAQYAAYALNDTVTLNGRAEVYRDDKGFFVAAFPGNLDFINAERGNAATVLGNSVGKTFGALTFGVTWKPPVPAPIQGLIIRPEIRYDRSLTDAKPYNGFNDQGAFTLGADVIVQF